MVGKQTIYVKLFTQYCRIQVQRPHFIDQNIKAESRLGLRTVCNCHPRYCSNILLNSSNAYRLPSPASFFPFMLTKLSKVTV